MVKFQRETKDTEWIIPVKFLKIVKEKLEPNTIDLEDIEAVLLALEKVDNADNQKLDFFVSRYLIEMVKGNAAVINEIYDSVMAIRKAVSLIGSALGDMNIRLEKLNADNL